MKKIMLLGDSIRMGYDDYVKMAFEGIAEVYYSNDNGRFAAYMLRNLTEWERDLDEHRESGKGDQIDVIHWNTGLWDCLEQLDGQVLTELPAYQSYLLRIYKVMRVLFPNAKLIFATSTAVVEHLFGRLKRKNSVLEEYNRIAVETLQPLGVEINDLYALTKDFPESYHSDSTHFNTKEGQSALVKQVVSCLEQALDIKAKPLDFDELFSDKKTVIGI